MGIDSRYIVQKKLGADEDVLAFHSRFMANLRPGIDRIPMRIYRHRRQVPFSTGLVNPFDAARLARIEPDVVNLHYIGEGFIPVRSLARIRKPIVWSLHDSWPFTGGCHVPGDCTAYQRSCGGCPMLGSDTSNDLSRWILNYKASQWREIDFVVAAGSRWMAECARNSALFAQRRVEVIHPGLSLDTFKPVDRAQARQMLSLPFPGQLILFGAMHSTTDPNKGFKLLHSAIKRLALSEVGRASNVIVFGSEQPDPAPDFGVPTRYMGRINDDARLALLYSAADVMVVPSISESFGQTASEAMACGTPVVAFGATGLLDIVTHKHDGYLARPFDPFDLTQGLQWVLSRGPAESRALAENARHTAVSRFSIFRMSERYIELYEDVASRPRRTTDATSSRHDMQ